MQYLIPIIFVIPIFGAIACALSPDRHAKSISLAASLLCLALGIPLAFGYQWNNPEVQYATDFGDIASIGVSLTFGLTSISLWLMLLTLFLQPLAILASFRSIRDRVKEYYAWMLVLLSAMLGVFITRDALVFYVFFELTLIPMFFIIGIWGGPQRRDAAVKFFLFTFTGGVFTLAALLYLGLKNGDFDLVRMVHYAKFSMGPTERAWIVLGLLAGFAVKVPLFPVHTWLPLAHTEAPTAGSAILAGVLLKLGTYGILLLVLPIGFATMPDLVWGVGLLSAVAILYGALTAWVQRDIKKLVAYSSVSHMGFCVLGLASLNFEGVYGSILYMINHGLSTGALFLCVGMVYDRFHTRDINELSGLAAKMPRFAFFFVLFSLSSIALPGLNGFASEFLTVQGAFKSSGLGVPFAAAAGLGMVLGAVYMLHLVAKLIFGPLKTPQVHENPEDPKGDLSSREIGILIPLALAVVIIGVIPGKLMNTFYHPVSQLLADVDQAKNPYPPDKTMASVVEPEVETVEQKP